jgi:hypothetical protein
MADTSSLTSLALRAAQVLRNQPEEKLTQALAADPELLRSAQSLAGRLLLGAMNGQEEFGCCALSNGLKLDNLTQADCLKLDPNAVWTPGPCQPPAPPTS